MKSVGSHESRSQWTLMKNSEFNNKHKNKDWKLSTIFSVWYFKHNIFPDIILKKHKSRLFAHGGMKQW